MKVFIFVFLTHVHSVYLPYASGLLCKKETRILESYVDIYAHKGRQPKFMMSKISILDQ